METKLKNQLITGGIVAGVLFITYLLFKERIRTLFIPKSQVNDEFPLKNGSIGERVGKLNSALVIKATNTANSGNVSDSVKKTLLDGVKLIDQIDKFNIGTERFLQMFYKVTEVDETLYNKIIK